MIELDKIYNMDCLEGMKMIPDGSVDCVICDLPYGVTECKWDAVIPFNILWEEYRHVCKENAAIILFGTEPFSSHLRLSNLKYYKYDWVWNKRNCSGFLNAKKQPLRSNELISVFYKKQCTYNPQMSLDRKPRKWSGLHKTYSSLYSKTGIFLCNTSAKDLAYPKTVLNFTGVVNNSKEKVGHPTQKPLELIRYLVRTYTNEGDIILDNCMGSGTTAVACIKEHRHFIGFETDKGYFDIANKRINEANNDLPLFC